MTKAGAIEYATQLTDRFNEFQAAMIARLDRLDYKVSKLKFQIKFQIKVSTETNAALAREVQRLNTRVVQLERQAVNDSQYLRKRQIELWNLPAPTTNSQDLKTEAAKILSLTGVAVTAGDIDVAHKLKKDGQVIVEMKSASKQFEILKARKELKNKKKELSDAEFNCPLLSVVESMSYEYKKLDFACRKLAKAKKIEKTFFFNRKLHLVTIGGEHHLIGHMTDLIKMFDQETIDRLFN